ncbi:MAG: Response regulator protein TmoT [Gammaproteobacteria bacterium]|nr:Response regulator protein TmoT [Gammaproteobacteria bacterium]
MCAVAATLIVYIVDDDDSVRKGLSRLIRSAGFEPRMYASSEQFLADVGPGEKGCVLLDITMPRLDGHEVQEQMTARHVDLPVIAVSARDDEETRHRAHELGARFFLRKPVDDQALLDAVDWVTRDSEPGAAKQK